MRGMIRRRRTGCQTCRKRRKKCDETRPICGGCARLDLKCNYETMPLKWAATRQPFIEHGTNSQAQSDKIYDFAEFHPSATSESDLRRVLHEIGISKQLQHTIFLSLGSMDQEILLKFLTSGYRTLISNLTVHDDFLEFFSECEQSFASLWSCLTYQVSMDQEYNDVFDSYYHKCLTLFRKEISEMATTENHDPIWFVGSLLCGISANRLLPWTIHVNAMVTFLRSRVDLAKVARDDNPLSEIVAMLGALDLSVYILNRKTVYHRLWARYNLGLSGIDEESGLPCSLIDLLAHLDDPGTMKALFDWQAPPGEPAQIFSWNATRNAAILRALEDSRAHSEIDVATTLTGRGISLHEIVQSLLLSVKQCIARLDPETTQFKQTLTFPLVMAASQRSVLCEDMRRLISSTLQNLAMDGSYHLRQGVLKVVHAHWENDADTIEETARRLDVELAMW